jgi:hypothetical protein
MRTGEAVPRASPLGRVELVGRNLATPEFKVDEGTSTELEANSLSGGCLADFDTKDREHLRRFSVGKNSRDTEGSNPPRSATQSAIFAFSPGKSKILRCERCLSEKWKIPPTFWFTTIFRILIQGRTDAKRFVKSRSSPAINWTKRWQEFRRSIRHSMTVRELRYGDEQDDSRGLLCCPGGRAAPWPCR